MSEGKNTLKLNNVTNLANKILKTKCVPTPIYNESQQANLIVKPRGTIFSKYRKGKISKF